MKTVPATDDSCHSRQQRGVGERLSTWIHQGKLRELTIDTLSVLDILDTDQKLIDLDHRIEDSKRSLRHTFRQLLLASYPWLVMAPFGFLIAFRSKAAIKGNSPESATAESLSDSHTGRGIPAG